MTQRALQFEEPTHLLLRFVCGHVMGMPLETLPAEWDHAAAREAATGCVCILCAPVPGEEARALLARGTGGGETR